MPMTESTIVTPRGWWDLADATAFYPSDLPEDWRLGYFANQFGASLIPWSFWSRTDAAEWSEWADDVTMRFRFVAEISPASNSPRPHAELQRALGHTLGAWLGADRHLDAQPDHDEPPESRRIPCWHATGSPPTRHVDADAYAAVAPSTLHRDLRGARRWLEELGKSNGQPPAVVILARPDTRTLTAWLQLVELLGLGPT
jgi:hypothetical protein